MLLFLSFDGKETCSSSGKRECTPLSALKLRYSKGNPPVSFGKCVTLTILTPSSNITIIQLTEGTTINDDR